MKCLDLLLANNPEEMRGVAGRRQDGYQWIMKTMFSLKSKIKKPNEKTGAKSLYDKFEYKVKQSTPLLIKADAQKTVGLCDALFDGDHILFINQLKT